MTPEELLKEVGEPVAYYDPDLDCGSAGISFDPLSDGIGLYTSDQVAAAVARATKPQKDQLAKAEQRVAEACALACEDVIGNTANDQRMIAAIDCSAMIRAGEWRKFVKEM